MRQGLLPGRQRSGGSAIDRFTVALRGDDIAMVLVYLKATDKTAETGEPKTAIIVRGIPARGEAGGGATSP